MKKLVCLLLTLALLTTTAFAAGADAILSVLEKSQTLQSADFTMDISAKLNQPLKFLSTIPKDEYADIDIALLMESLADATLHLEGSFLMSEDRQKADVAVTSAFDVPISFNKNLRLDAWAQIGSWVQYDFTEPENPVYRTITEEPFSNKYQVLDMPNPEGFAQTLSSETQAMFLAASLSLLKETASFSQENGFYTIKFTDETLRQYLLKLIPLYQEYLPEPLPETEKVFSGMKTFLEHCSLLGSKGMSVQIKITPNGFISVENSEIHVSLNLYDILSTFEKTTKGLNREDAWIDVTLTLKETLNRHNEVTEVSIPEVNDENSYFSGGSSSNYYLQEAPIFTENAIYYPMEKIAKHYGFSIEKQDAMAAIATPDGEHIVAFLPDTNTLFVDGAQVPTEVVPAILQDEKLYCSQEVFALLGIDISVSASGSSENSLRICSYYYDPSVIEEESGPEEGADYEPRYHYFSFYHNQMPPVIDGQCYMPIYEFLLELTPGEFSYGDGSLRFVADGENPLNVREVSAWVGDPHIYWNGEGLPLGGTVVEQNGIMYIPVEFAEQLQLSSSATISFYAGHPQAQYHMELENPDYVEDYTPYFLFYDVNSDQTMYVEEERLYMPGYDFFASLFEGTFTFEGEWMTYTAAEENSFDIQTISVRSGDEFVMVNGEPVQLDAPAVTVNQVLRIPVSFAQQLGLDIGSIFMSDFGTSFHFSKKNPAYEENEKEFWYELF